jgi:hypothetical protein
VLLLTLVTWSLLSARQWALAELAKPQSLRNWEAWRSDVRERQTQPGPVQRRVPKSMEPPALVLMRDYFEVSLAGALVFSSILFWVVAWFVTGILSSDRESGEKRSGLVE